MLLTVDCGNTNTVFALYAYDSSIVQKGCWRIYNNPKRKYIWVYGHLFAENSSGALNV